MDKAINSNLDATSQAVESLGADMSVSSLDAAKVKPLTPEVNVVAKYHTPRIAVIIPHFNYSEFLEEALISVQQQTYKNFTCVVVDDCSTGEHFPKAQKMIQNLKDDRFIIIRTKKNVGQIGSFFKGIDHAATAFVSLLDPDDRYTPEFLETMLAAHLSPAIYCPLVCSDQYLLKNGHGIVTATQYGYEYRFNDRDRHDREELSFKKNGFHRYVHPTETGWHWTSTSSMMFRTEALNFLRPRRKFSYIGEADAYFAYGAHMMGGTILIHTPLAYRLMHHKNYFLNDAIFSRFQRHHRPGSKFYTVQVMKDVVETFLSNGGLTSFSVKDFKEVIYAHFGGLNLVDLMASVPAVKKLLTETQVA